MATSIVSNSLTSSGGASATSQKQQFLQALYKNCDTQSSSSLYSKDDDDEYFDAYEQNPSWASPTPPITPSYLSSLRQSLEKPFQQQEFEQILPSSSFSNPTSGSTSLSTTPSQSLNNTSDSNQYYNLHNTSNNNNNISMNESYTSTSSILSSINNSPSTSPVLQSSPSSRSSNSVSPTPPPVTIQGPLPSNPSSSKLTSSKSKDEKAKRNSRVLSIIKSKKDDIIHNFFPIGSKNDPNKNSSNSDNTLGVNSGGNSNQVSPASSAVSPQGIGSTSTNAPSGGNLSNSGGTQTLCNSNSSNISVTSVGSNATMTHSHSSLSLSSESFVENTSDSHGNKSEESRVSRWIKNHTPLLKKKEYSVSNFNSISKYQLQNSFQAHKGGIWSSEISLDSSLLATGGADNMIRIWRFNPTGPQMLNESSLKHQLTGHTGQVLEVKWVSNNLLLSSSIDKTVKLWEIETGECIKTFEHNDIVVSMCFDYSSSESIFFSGTLDGQIRKWSLNNTSQPIDKYEITPTEFITNVSLSNHPRLLIISTHIGNLIFMNPDQNWSEQNSNNSGGGSGVSQNNSSTTPVIIHKFNVSQNSHSTKRGKGPKIVGVTIASSSSLRDTNANEYLLVSTNDSCIRQFILKDFKRICKYTGLILENYQIKPTLSHDKRSIIIGSEDNSVYCWDNFIESQNFSIDDIKSKLTIENFDQLSNASNKAITSTNLITIQNNNYLISTDASGNLIIFNK